MNEEQIQAILDRVDERVDSKIESMIGDLGSMTPVAFEQKWMKGYTSTMPIDQALFRRYLRYVNNNGGGTYFKTIGGVSASEANDEMDVLGQSGISVGTTTAGKNLVISGFNIMKHIDEVIEWDNFIINKTRIAMWMKEVEDSPMDGMYVMNFSDTIDWYKYWEEMRSRIGTNEGIWVAYDNEHLCYVTKEHYLGEDIYQYVIHIPYYDLFMSIEETRDSVSGNTLKLYMSRKISIYEVLIGG